MAKPKNQPSPHRQPKEMGWPRLLQASQRTFITATVGDLRDTRGIQGTQPVQCGPTKHEGGWANLKINPRPIAMTELGPGMPNARGVARLPDRARPSPACRAAAPRHGPAPALARVPPGPEPPRQ